MKTLYLIKGFKECKPFTGDSNQDVVRVLVPAYTLGAAEDLAKPYIDKLVSTLELYTDSIPDTETKICFV